MKDVKDYVQEAERIAKLEAFRCVSSPRAIEMLFEVLDNTPKDKIKDIINTYIDTKSDLEIKEEDRKMRMKLSMQNRGWLSWLFN